MIFIKMIRQLTFFATAEFRGEKKVKLQQCRGL
ncbi:hypothetical protein EATG_03726 [Escherichia coli H605]|uniref:Uncharacterized protein n=1 Tax=Escherichia coli H605 TaxID=656410 RepID=A0AAJ3NWI6_ECOLX|nr:hypothetical protein EATG_03726 [Escherichia coli H605]